MAAYTPPSAEPHYTVVELRQLAVAGVDDTFRPSALTPILYELTIITNRCAKRRRKEREES